MTRTMRNAHYCAIVVSLAGVCLGIAAGMGLLVGWSVFWGAYSTSALRAGRK